MIYTIKIDTDPDSNLLLMLTNMLNGVPQQRQKVIAITAVQFAPYTRGYLLVADDGKTTGS